MFPTAPKGPACIPPKLHHLTHPAETLGAADGQEGPPPPEAPGSPRRSSPPSISEKAPSSPFPLQGGGLSRRS